MTINTFRDDDFINQYFLTEDTIFDYFRSSPFYDESCLNQTFILQSQYSNFDFSEKIKTFKGKFYEASLHLNNIFIIKYFYNDTKEIKLVNAYYVIEGNIFEAPSSLEIYEKNMIDILENLGLELKNFVEKRDFCIFEGVSMKENTGNTKIKEALKCKNKESGNIFFSEAEKIFKNKK